MKVKIIKTIFIILVVGIISFSFIRNGINQIDNKKQEAKFVKRTAPSIKETVVEQKKLNESKLLTPKPFENSPDHVADQYNRICTNDFTNELMDKSKMVGSASNKERTEEQLAAFYKVAEKCRQWNEYWDSLSDEKKIEHRNRLKDSREMESFFQDAIQNRDRSLIETARSIIKTGGDSSLFSSDVLLYLLKVDNEFKKEIARRMNVVNVGAYSRELTKKSMNIVGLYGCAVEPELVCNSDSIGILSLCSDFGLMCGESYEQYLMESTTANEYADLRQIVNIIINLVKEGFFDD